MKIVAISDTHGKWNKITIPECDVLVSAGDYSFRGEPHMVKDFHKWLNSQPAKHIISCQGNHEIFEFNRRSIPYIDFAMAKQLAQEACPKVHFVEEEGIEIDGVKFWASAWTPTYHNWGYNANRGEEIAEHWSKIPKDTEVLITHGPPYQILDAIYQSDQVTVQGYTGCQDLMAAILQLPKLKVSIFGHIHESYGTKEFHGIQFYNASICDIHYTASNTPWVIDYDPSVSCSVNRP